MYNKVVADFLWRTWRETVHHGDKDFALDSSPLLDLGIAIFLILLNKIFSVLPRKTKPGLTQNPSLLNVIPSGITNVFH